MQNNIKISVIIPCYNAQKYLKECITSDLIQTFKDFELICINDGSLDNTLEILKEFSLKDERVKIIDKINEGAAQARNDGILEAKGKYIMFLDSDDCYAPNALEIAYRNITKDNSEICVFGFSSKINNEIKRAKFFNQGQHFSSINDKEELSEALVFIWDKIYKTDFLRQNNISFMKNCKTSEDISFCWECLFNGAKISCIYEPLYIYRVDNFDSVTTSKIGILSDLETFKKFSEKEIFKSQTKDNQLKVVNRFCNGWEYYLPRFRDHKKKIKEVLKTAQIVFEYMESKFGKKEIRNLKSYKKFQKTKFKLFFNSIFSIRNSVDKKHKIIIIFGIYIKIRSKK